MAIAAINEADHAAAIYHESGRMGDVKSIRPQPMIETIALNYLAVFIEQKGKRHLMFRKVFFRLEKALAFFRRDVEQVASGAGNLILE